jgi:hypothetical protein
MVFFNMVDSEWKTRVYWRHEFWSAGLANHFQRLNELSLKNSEIRSLLDIISKDYEQDIRALSKQDAKK